MNSGAGMRHCIRPLKCDATSVVWLAFPLRRVGNMIERLGAELLHHAVSAVAAGVFAALAPRRPRAAHGVALGLAL
jgi:hypothetical protein